MCPSAAPCRCGSRYTSEPPPPPSPVLRPRLPQPQLVALYPPSSPQAHRWPPRALAAAAPARHERHREPAKCAGSKATSGDPSSLECVLLCVFSHLPLFKRCKRERAQFHEVSIQETVEQTPPAALGRALRLRPARPLRREKKTCTCWQHDLVSRWGWFGRKPKLPQRTINVEHPMQEIRKGGAPSVPGRSCQRGLEFSRGPFSIPPADKRRGRIGGTQVGT